MRQQHLVLTGIPASGKSTVGKAIAEALGLEMFDKDEILEDLFNDEGDGDLNRRTILSRTADDILRERVSRSESSVIVSWWRHPKSILASGTDRVVIRVTRRLNRSLLHLRSIDCGRAFQVTNTP